MNNDIFRFSVGSYECLAVSDGTLTYAPPMFPPPAAFLFYNAPKEALEKAFRDYQVLPEQWTSSYTCLVVRTGKNTVLIDTGAGSFAPTTGKLIPNLMGEGISPEDIDTVILTHAHPDHLGGSTDPDGRPAFPRARWFMLGDEWEFWTTARAERELAEHGRDLLIGIARKNLSAIGNVNLVGNEEEIVEGIRAIAAPGHTPGQMALDISSGGAHLLYVSDAVLHPIHLEFPDWCATVDTSPGQIPVTRSRLLQTACDEKYLVMAFHFPFPGLGYIVRKGRGWEWQPLK